MELIPVIFISVFSLIELFLLRKFIVKKEKIAIKSAVGSLIIFGLIFIARYYYKFIIPYVAYALVILSLFMNSYFGYYLDLFNKSRRYDRIQHVIGSFSFAIFFYYLSNNVFEYGGSKIFRAFYILLLGVFWGTINEIFEFVSDLKNKEKMQKGLRDTNVDIIADIIGSLLASVISFFIFL